MYDWTPKTYVNERQFTSGGMNGRLGSRPYGKLHGFPLIRGPGVPSAHPRLPEAYESLHWAVGRTERYSIKAAIVAVGTLGKVPYVAVVPKTLCTPYMGPHKTTGYNTYIGGICCYISRVLFHGYPTFHFDWRVSDSYCWWFRNP